MKKLLIMALATLFGCSLTAQDKSVIDMINQKGNIEPVEWVLKNERNMEECLHKVDYLTQSDLDFLSEMMTKEISRMDNILKTRDLILGKEKKESKQEKRLKKYFTDTDKAKKCFAQAEEIKARANLLLEKAKLNKRRSYHAMPSGKLTAFQYSAGNGFAGWSSSVSLKKNKDGNGGTLTYDNRQRMRVIRDGQEEQEKPKTVNVEDSVFVKVYSIIKEGGLYDEQNNYQPLMDVTDGTNWSCWMNFEGNVYISTGGYMAGPNHQDALNDVLKYLKSVFDQIAPPEKEKK